MASSDSPRDNAALMLCGPLRIGVAVKFVINRFYFENAPRRSNAAGSQTKQVKYADIYSSQKNSASDAIGEQARSSSIATLSRAFIFG
jgi:hypothetical protein